MHLLLPKNGQPRNCLTSAVREYTWHTHGLNRSDQSEMPTQTRFQLNTTKCYSGFGI